MSVSWISALIVHHPRCVLLSPRAPFIQKSALRWLSFLLSDCFTWPPANQIKAPRSAKTSVRLRYVPRGAFSRYLWMSASLDIYGQTRRTACLTMPSQNNPPRHSWAPPPPPPGHVPSPAAMTKFIYSEYLSQFRNAGGKCNKVSSRPRGDRRRGDAASDPEWVFCCLRVCPTRGGCVRARARVLCVPWMSFCMTAL